MKKRIILAFLLILSLVVFGGCTKRYYTVSRGTVNDMLNTLENPCRQYDYDDYTDAFDTLKDYFKGVSYVSQSDAKDAFNVLEVYIGDLQFIVDEAIQYIYMME